MIQPDTVVAGIRLARAEESWEAVMFSGLIPFLGAVGVLVVLWRAVKSNPENDLPPEQRPGGTWVHGVPPANEVAAEQNQEQGKGDGPEGPPP